MYKTFLVVLIDVGSSIHSTVILFSHQEGLGPALVASSSLLANGGAAAAEAGGGAAAPGADETDTLLAHTPDLHRTRAALEHVSHKIARTRELIKAEQTTRDGEVSYWFGWFGFAHDLLLNAVA